MFSLARFLCEWIYFGQFYSATRSIFTKLRSYANWVQDGIIKYRPNSLTSVYYDLKHQETYIFYTWSLNLPRTSHARCYQSSTINSFVLFNEEIKLESQEDNGLQAWLDSKSRNESVVKRRKSQVGESIWKANNHWILTCDSEGGYPEKEVTTPQNAAGQTNVNTVRIKVCSPAPCQLLWLLPLLLLAKADVDGFHDNCLMLRWILVPWRWYVLLLRRRVESRVWWWRWRW